MRAQKSGAIINISSMAAITTYPYVAYKATKSAMIAFTEQLAYQNAQYGIRANVILPGLMNTPMAVDTRAREFKKSRAEVEAERDAKVPLRHKMGTGWDVANAALFLASDEASFITGVTLAGGRRRERAAGIDRDGSASDRPCAHSRRSERAVHRQRFASRTYGSQTLMVRRRDSAVSNHEARLCHSSFETRVPRSSG